MHNRLIRFLLLCEGSSDRPLVSHLERLLVHCGAQEAVGDAIALAGVGDPGGIRGEVLERKVRSVLEADSEFELIFIHRDADAAGHEERAREVIEALRRVDPDAGGIPLIPVRTTEAWLLLDENAIRRVAGKPRGKQALGLPRPARVEQIADPKGVLADALANASGYEGHHLRKFKSKFGSHRRVLLEQLPVGGPLNEVPAWRRLEVSVAEFVGRPAPR